MALLINGIDGNYLLPRILNAKYKYAPFERILKVQVISGGRTEIKEVNVKNKIQEAWNFVTNRAAKHAPCNNYFKTLQRGKTLEEVLREANITLHCLEPKEGYDSDVVPNANAAGRDIGIYPGLLLENTSANLACTLIHELAHLAGATTNKADPNAHAAEKSLNSCLCAEQYNKDALGRLQKIRIGGRSDSRLV